MSMLHLTKQHRDTDQGQLEEMIAELAIPWYVNFYMGWRERRDVLMVSYEDLIAYPEETIASVMTFAGLSVTNDETRAAINRVNGQNRSRLNVGIAGRGRQLSPTAIATIRRKLDLYPEAAGDTYIAAMHNMQVGDDRESVAPLPRPKPTIAQGARARLNRLWAHLSHAVFRLRWRWRHNGSLGATPRALARGAALIVSLVYLNWSRDLVPDTQPLGMVDDSLVMVAAIMSFIII
jgi:hypothetical protein